MGAGLSRVGPGYLERMVAELLGDGRGLPGYEGAKTSDKLTVFHLKSYPQVFPLQVHVVESFIHGCSSHSIIEISRYQSI